MRKYLCGIVVVTTFAVASTYCHADELVTNSGSVYRGRVVSQDASSVTFEVVSGSGHAEIVFPRAQISSLNIDGKVPLAPAATPSTAPALKPLIKPATKPAEPVKPVKPLKPVASQPAPQGKYKDGTFNGKAKGFRADITLAIKIKNSRIETITVVSTKDDKGYWKRATAIIPEIIKNNGTESVATVTRATFSSKGIINATKDALSKALREPAAK